MPPLGGGRLPGAMVGEVVDVDAEHDRGAAGGERLEHAHELALAVVAAVRAVAGVRLDGELLRRHRAPVEIPLGRQRGTVLQLLGRQRGRYGGDADGTAAAEHPTGDGGEQAESAPPEKPTTTSPNSLNPASSRLAVAPRSFAERVAGSPHRPGRGAQSSPTSPSTRSASPTIPL